ncbi:hypothetical protein AB0K49_29785 [Streptomyces decoyicus]|uniref:hypothetical protein n=1 Tax=Streptomyces decoyicus TaxID=249567 RepID=UPI00345CEA2B
MARRGALREPERIRLPGLGPGPRAAAGAVVADPDGIHRRWLAGIGATAAAVRPDNYVCAAGPDANEVAASHLLAALTSSA